MKKVEIIVKSRLDPGWSEWFDNLAIEHSGSDKTVIMGTLEDMAAFYGLMDKIKSMGLQLVSVKYY